MNRHTGLIGVVIAVVMLIVVACGGDALTSPDGTDPGGSLPVASPPGVPSGAATPPSGAPSSGPAGHVVEIPDTCTLTTPGELADVVGFHFLPGQDASAATGWSSACAWVQAVAVGEAPYNVNIRALAEGSLTAFGKLAGATPVAGLADEAYVFDDGRQVAMRFGSVIIVVGGARGIDGDGVPASAVGALARLIASRLQA